MERRTREGGRYSGVSIFSGKIRCGVCGGYFGAKGWHSTDKYRRVIYRCNRKYKGDKCQTRHVTEDEIKEAFVTAFNRLVAGREEVIANAKLVRQTPCDTTVRAEERVKLQQELAVLVEMQEKAIRENARITQKQEAYQRNYEGLLARYDAAKARLDEVTEAISSKEAQSERLAVFIKRLKAKTEPVAKFDSQLWAGHGAVHDREREQGADGGVSGWNEDLQRSYGAGILLALSNVLGIGSGTAECLA